MSNASTLQSLNTEYYRLIECSLSPATARFLRESPETLIHQLIPKRLQEVRLFGAVGNVRKSALELEIDGLLANIGAFWKSNHDAFTAALSKAAPYALTLQCQHFVGSLEQALCRLGIYFDTILLVDPLHIANEEKLQNLTDDRTAISIKGQILARLSYVLRVQSAAIAELDPPVFLLAPDLAYDPGREHTGDLAAQFLADTCGLDRAINSAESLRDLLLGTDSGKRIRVRRPAGLVGLLQRFAKPPALTWKIFEENAEFSASDTSIRDYPVDRQLRSLHWYVSNTIYSIRETVGNALTTGTDPFLYGGNKEIYDWYQRHIVNAARLQIPNVSEEKVIAEAFG